MLERELPSGEVQEVMPSVPSPVRISRVKRAPTYLADYMIK